MRGFKYDDIHTADNWALVLTGKAIDPPTPKLYEIDLEGADGTLDLSESLTGELRYNNRTITAAYAMTEGALSERTTLMRTIVNYLHGKKRKIVDPDYPDYYYVGRSIISDVQHNQAYSTFTVTSTCEPWRYYGKHIISVNDINSSDYITLTFINNGAKTACPLITVSGFISIMLNGSAVELSAGQQRITDLKLYSGSNDILVNGNGTLTFDYEEADL